MGLWPELLKVYHRIFIECRVRRDVDVDGLEYDRLGCLTARSDVPAHKPYFP